MKDENQRDRHGFSISMWNKQIRRVQNDTGMQIYTNAKGWWDRHLTMHFLQFHFENRSDMTEPIQLLLDDFSGHWTKEVVEYAKEINVTLMKIPPNATSVSQPAGATWNGPLKVRLRNTWVRNLREQLRARRPGTPFKLKAPDRALLCSWIYATWSDVAASTISGGFRKCGFIKRLDERERVSHPATEVQERTDDIVDEVLSAGQQDTEVGSFTLDDDFDVLFRDVAEINEHQ
ncbi:hypothetical protein PR003_g31463 [Phytophthora rubi]|uniref:DDE-1 domain-containing protein n=1 Tax=Phytophthora rubi TaxID=129364 RepID=A0A6A3GRG6_9STRA|nr:hypothetical protein PR001_g31525 [Phytophthora rubi]KAE9268387.1 hypothetical protein PR003_g31463 [Phytophthora rubi]